MSIVQEIETKLMENLKDKCNEDILKIMIEDLKNEGVLIDSQFVANWSECMYDNLYRILLIRINYQKQKNEKKLTVARCFYSLCDDKDILEDIMKNL
tara:strand:+ start:428 stop:718 length:291 start_codon:yes stop_codon:yes gene_type:complete